MKKIAYLLFILIALGACKKDQFIQDFIIAGDRISHTVLFTDIEPDIVLQFDYPSSSDTSFLDINQDGIDDLGIFYTGSASPAHSSFSSGVIPLENTQIAVFEAGSDLAAVIEENDLIDANLNYTSETAILQSYTFSMISELSIRGLWKSMENKYLGIRIVDKDTFYAWIKLDVGLSASPTIKEFACIQAVDE